jgi:hypothetical protein
VSIRVIWTVPARPNRTEVSTVIRSRTARLVSAAVVGSAVLAGTSACGSGPMKAGAAAMVGGHRISDTDLQSRVAEVQDLEARHAAEIAKIQAAVAAAGGSAPATNIVGAPDQLRQLLLDQMWVKAAALVGASAGTQADGAEMKALTDWADGRYKAAGLPTGDPAAERIAVSAQAAGQNIAPSGVQSVAHDNALEKAIITALAAKLNVDPSSISQPGPLGTAMNQLVVEAAKEVSAETTLSPRYGTTASLDLQTGNLDLGSTTPAWVRIPSADKPAAPVVPNQG